MNRRRFLVSVGTLAAGTATSVDAVAPADGDDCEPVDVPVAIGANDTVRTEPVPRASLEQAERAREVQDELRRTYGDEPWFASSAITTGERTVCGEGALAVSIGVDDREEAVAILPDEVDGVEIVVEEGGNFVPGSRPWVGRDVVVAALAGMGGTGYLLRRFVRPASD